ncbi:hypothetical protein Belba_2247 [Belliella baltica DSM 15883]|uniref:Uncharacterized protein n=1 Tax=Belliella baltica (strain DSM 15883 / CIP 108006 / LMG 21964 / BA134) TaxID=866536 RepID=I3Z6E5_BELBD|nr:hypothetical protein Belba_2247 [Belliella baltica DSM 15883]
MYKNLTDMSRDGLQSLQIFKSVCSKNVDLARKQKKRSEIFQTLI